MRTSVMALGGVIVFLVGGAAVLAGGSWWVLGSVLITYTVFAFYWLANGGRFDR